MVMATVAEELVKTGAAKALTNYGSPAEAINTHLGYVPRGLWQEEEQENLQKKGINCFRAKNEMGETALYLAL